MTPPKKPDAYELPIGTRVTEPGILGASVKYAPGRWARTAFDHSDEFINLILTNPAVTVELP